MTNDLALLRRFEPIIRYTKGERFFPTSVEDYVRECSLWMQRPGEEPQCLIPEGELTLEKLAETRAAPFGTIHYLKFIEPLNLAELAVLTIDENFLHRRQDEFRAGAGRLARVGYGSRFVDALFSLTLFARGRVPGDTAAAAAQAYRKIMTKHEHHAYYGRVVRTNGWVALQYWFFYPFNNWRSGFFGVNDHEADWEMIYIYCSETERGAINPEWIAYASHDFSGDDLRRRWDDPEVDKVGEHPVIYAGAGSHASYYQKGDYLAELELPFLRPFIRTVDWLQRRWRKWIGETTKDDAGFNIFRVPFVDYARGDGLSLGPGQEKEWTVVGLLEPPPSWAYDYRGLWGLFAQDPISGENAPAGPLYNRDGSFRRSWYDPLGWAGLDKVPPPDETLKWALERHTDTLARRDKFAKDINAKNHELMELYVETEAMAAQPHLQKAYTERLKRVDSLAKELAELRAKHAADEALLEALQKHIAALERGERGPMRDHIHHAHHPDTEASKQLNRVAEVWSALSVGLLMVGFVLVLIFARQYWLIWLTVLVSTIFFIEATFRRRLTQLINSVAIGLALLCALILLFEFFWETVMVGALVAGAYITWENWRELRR